jgi:hypothetical protein
MKSVTVTPAPVSFRALILIGALVAPILLWPRASFAYLSAPLSPVYLGKFTDGQGSCLPGYVIHTSPSVPCDQFIAYVYTTQVAGTSPVYLNSTMSDFSCQYMQLFIGGSASNGCAQFIGYFNTTQVDGTSPIYLNASADEFGCTSNYSIGTSPSNVCAQFIGYGYLTLPPPVNFTVFPKFVIGSVIYVPPGQGASSIAYGAGTVTGTTVSTTDSWSKDSSIGIQVGSFSITFGDNFGGQTTQSVDMQETISQTTTYRAPPSDFVNHDYDQIQIFLGVNVNASADYLGNVTWGLDYSQVASRGFAETGYGITVGCLRPTSTIPSSQCAPTLNFLDSVGITAADYPSLLGADPFADPNASHVPDPNRYVVIDSVAYFADPTATTINYTENNSTTKTNQEIFNYKYSVGATFNDPSGSGHATMKVSETLTFSNMSTRTNKSGSTNSSTFTLSMPSTAYTGPTTLFVYLDTVFKTFMFSHIGPCVPTTCAAQGKNCGSIADGCGGTLSCGVCSSSQTCGGGGTANVCGCTPTTCAAQGKNCGTIPDGCGGTLSCGSCAAPKSCGGGGVANVCGGCTPVSCASAGYQCGPLADGCGNTLNCGSCATGMTCGSGICRCKPGTVFCDPGCFARCP